MGVALGLFARVAYEQGLFAEVGYAPGNGMDEELGLPLLLSNILPIGLMGLMMSAYFSAIMSTADSCLMAASGNFTTDIWKYFTGKNGKRAIRQSQLVTLVIGIVAIILATAVESVLDLMLNSYAFMVSGLLIPVLGTLIYKKPSAVAALTAMVLGGTVTLTLILIGLELPFGLDPNFFGITVSLLSFLTVHEVAGKNASN
jgi:SSS family solute:Na+ symporter